MDHFHLGDAVDSAFGSFSLLRSGLLRHEDAQILGVKTNTDGRAAAAHSAGRSHQVSIGSDGQEVLRDSPDLLPSTVIILDVCCPQGRRARGAGICVKPQPNSGADADCVRMLLRTYQRRTAALTIT